MCALESTHTIIILFSLDIWPCGSSEVTQLMIPKCLNPRQTRWFLKIWYQLLYSSEDNGKLLNRNTSPQTDLPDIFFFKLWRHISLQCPNAEEYLKCEMCTRKVFFIFKPNWNRLGTWSITQGVKGNIAISGFSMHVISQLLFLAIS